MKTNILKENERIDDLEYKGLKIIQNKDGFCFGIDSIILSDFAKEIKNESKVIDLGTGTGILGILLCSKTQTKNIIGIDIQQEVCNMAIRSINMNGLQDRFQIINKDIRDLDKIFDKNSFDVVVTNPPYKKKQTGLINENTNKLISKHELTATLEDFIHISSNLLKDRGSLYMVNRPERLSEIICVLNKYKLKPKVLRLVQPKIDKPPNLVLIKAVKNAREFLKLEKTLIIYNKDGMYSDEILEIYNKN